MSQNTTNTAVAADVLDEMGAAGYLGDVPPRTLRQWRYLGKGPVYVKIGRHVRYRRADLDAFLASHRIDPSAA